MSELVIPPGFGLMKFRWRDDTGSGKTSTCACGYGDSPLVNTAVDDANFFADIAEGIPAGSDRRPGRSSDVPSGWSFQGVTVYKNVGGVITQGDSEGAPVNGLASGTSVSYGLTGRVTKRTGVVGRKFTGRMFVPLFVPMADVLPGGALTSDAVLIVKERYNTFLAAVQAEAFNMYILHTDGVTPPTRINNFFLQPTVGIQKRRLSR